MVSYGWFDITLSASEIMAVLCLATSLTDLKERLSRIVVAILMIVNSRSLLGCEGAITSIEKMHKPNLAQTLTRGHP